MDSGRRASAKPTLMLRTLTLAKKNKFCTAPKLDPLHKRLQVDKIGPNQFVHPAIGAIIEEGRLS